MIIPDQTELNSNVKRSPRYLNKHYPEFYKKISELPGRNLAEKLYMYYNNLSSIPVCETCGKKFKTFKTFESGYGSFCSKICSAINPDRILKSKQTLYNKYGVYHQSQAEEIKEKIKQTNLERYGVEVSSKSKKVKEKTKQTNLKRYGVECSFQSEEIREKIKQTNLEKYGVENILQSEEIREKIKQTNLERYGVENLLQSDEFREKIKQTNLEKYGVENIFQSEEFREKIKQTWIKNYGVDNPLKNKEIQDKVKKTNLKKYGVEYGMQNKDIAVKNRDSRMKSFINKKDFIIKILETGEWVCKCPHLNQIKSEKCLDCDKTYVINSSLFYARKEFDYEPCTKLLPAGQFKNQGTKIELFIQDILDELQINYIKNSRDILNGQELDIFIPDKNIAIECNGVYWHSTNYSKDIKKHFNKWKKCQEKNIQLLTIWEDWIVNKPEIVRSIIKNKINKIDCKIPARKCKVVELDSKTTRSFLEENHIQGFANSKIKLGLKYENEIVCVMTFSKKSKLSGSCVVGEYEYDLNRFCNKLNTTVLGGASKLLKYFIQKYNPKSITSFSSNDISNGSLYEKLGFKKESVSLSYWYISRGYNRYHRSSFSKSELIRKKLIPPEYEGQNWTEKQITEVLGLLTIYDSGHITWKINL